MSQFILSSIQSFALLSFHLSRSLYHGRHETIWQYTFLEILVSALQLVTLNGSLVLQKHCSSGPDIASEPSLSKERARLRRGDERDETDESGQSGTHDRGVQGLCVPSLQTAVL